MKTEDEYVYLPLADVMEGGGICQHLKDRYWSVHPKRGLLFYPYNKRKPDIRSSSPQCNANEEIAKRLCPAFAETKFIESVLQPINAQDYAQ